MAILGRLKSNGVMQVYSRIDELSDPSRNAGLDENGVLYGSLFDENIQTNLPSNTPLRIANDKKIVAYNYFDERTLTKILKQTNILEKDGDISSRPFDYNELMNVLNNIETTSPADLPTRSGNNNYNNLEEVKQKILQTIEFIDKMQISISNAHDVQREQQKKIQNLQGDIIPDE